MIGSVTIPPDFKYMEAYLKGRPQHDRYDRFSIRHPKMDVGKRAKLFAPFDALRGFNFAISRKEVLYEEQPELGAEDLRELNRRLETLRDLTYTSRMAKRNRVAVTLTYFEPCSDPHHDAYGKLGQIRTVTGICRRVDPDISMTFQIGNTVVAFDRIIRIESDGPWLADNEVLY